MKWRVERAGSRIGLGYASGWLALRGDGYGAWCSTWTEAMEFVEGEIARARII